MKWYWWVLIIIVVIIIIALIRKKMINKDESKVDDVTKSFLNGNFGDLFDMFTNEDKSIKNDNVRNYIQGLINQKFDLPSIKEIAKSKSILVLDENETHTMEFNPRRVIVKKSQITIYCIKAPCPPIETLEIISVG